MKATRASSGFLQSALDVTDKDSLGYALAMFAGLKTSTEEAKEKQQQFIDNVAHLGPALLNLFEAAVSILVQNRRAALLEELRIR